MVPLKVKKAVIDIGTNTFNLLIARADISGIYIVETHKEAVSLGMGGINDNRIADSAIKRAMNAFKAFKVILDVHGISKPRLIATSAVRDAKNAASFVSLVSQTFNWEVDIITGLEEAKLIYKGVRQCYDFRYPAVIMDIGGGSTEFIVADNKGIQKEVSLNIGVSRLYQGFEVSDPFCDNDIRNIENFLEERDQGFFDNITARTLIGSSGTFETFYELINQMPFPKSSKTIELELEPFIEALDALIYSTLTERNKNKFIIPIRKQMAPFAAVKTKWVIQKLQPERVLISPYSLKEGAFI